MNWYAVYMASQRQQRYFEVVCARLDPESMSVLDKVRASMGLSSRSEAIRWALLRPSLRQEAEAAEDQLFAELLGTDEPDASTTS